MRLNYINSQKKQAEKERLRLVISSIRVGVVAKTDDEVYVSSTIENLKSLPPCKNGREEDDKFFGQFLLHPVVFQKRKYQIFWSGLGSCPLRLPDQLPYDCLNLGFEILPKLQWIFSQLVSYTYYQVYETNWLSSC